MRKTLTTALILLLLPLSTSLAENQGTEQVGDMGKMTEKEKLTAELRTFRKLYMDDKAKKQGGNPVSQSVTKSTGPITPVENPEFGIDDLYPNAPPPKLDTKTKAALKKTQKWLHQTNTPIVQKGKIIHPYGEGVPTLVLEPLAISNIELSPDETVVSEGLQLGDAVNWSVRETYAGTRSGKRPNLIVKSKSLDEMKTILIIVTTKRIYHVQLVSSHGEWTPQLSFSYPDEAVIRSPETLPRILAERSIKKPGAAHKQEPTDAYLYAAGDIDFGYTTKGDAKIMPARVFSLGHQTVIEMADSIEMVNAPALLLEDSEGNEEVVNYRFIDHRYILDQPIYKAHLMSGVGWDQQKVTIQKLED